MRNTLYLVGAAVSIALLAGILSGGCSANSSGSSFNGAGGSGSASGAEGGPGGAMFGCNACIGNSVQLCDANGNLTTKQDCTPQVCVALLGCQACMPGQPTCVGNEIHTCNADGTAGDLVLVCDPAKGEICGNGKCGGECDVLAGSASYVGCEFWAVDLPNERGGKLINNTPPNWAAYQPWGVAIVNAGQTAANVTIDINDAPYGQPVQTKLVQALTLAPGELKQVVLPTREVTGGDLSTADPPGPPMTMLASAAYRITSSAPLIVTQFNLFENSFSNDASLLLPSAALGSTYRVLGYPTANPIVVPGLPTPAGIPDHASVTVVGVQAGTTVTIKLSADIKGNAAFGIPAALAGDVITASIGPFDTLNIASRSDCKMVEIARCGGDFTGTIVQASHPVVVFTSGERAILGPVNYSGGGESCCTDHLEEQMFPVSALGKSFVITHSPPRGTEPDVIRFMGVAEAAQIVTTLPAPDDVFMLQPGELRETNMPSDIAVTASAPIVIGTLEVSQTFTTDFIGDPDLTIFPPVEQYRKTYTFLVPGSWTHNYVVVATEEGNALTLDGVQANGCQKVTGPQLNGVQYDAWRCELQEGTHAIAGEKPFGITVYGYGPAGSYAFVGGADVKPIYTPPPLF